MADARYEVAVIGGGPAGLAAALTLGRARRKTLLLDAGPRRNAAAQRMHGFLTRDGIAPSEFRRIAHAELTAYPSVERHEAAVQAVRGERGAFQLELATRSIQASRVLLCTGMIDEVPALPGLRELWGRSIFQCPYCHGWEVRGRRFGYWVTQTERLHFALLLRAWTDDVVVFTDARVELPSALRESLLARHIQIEERPLGGLMGRDGALTAVTLSDGDVVPCDVLFVHPPQRQVDAVRSMGLALTADGYVRVDDLYRQTSIVGVYAAGDLTTPAQSATLAAAAGSITAAMCNHDLMAEQT